jgi:hypothetical protein
MRFYIEGYEQEVQDPSFFMDDKEYLQIEETLLEMMETYSKIAY